MDKSNPEGTSANMGSLLRLFKSDHFDAWMAISYLYRFSKQPGVFSYLCNEFYKLSDDDVEFYLAQICSLVVFQHPQTQALFIFLMDKASKSVHFAIKIGWMFSALSEPKNEAITDRCALLRRDTENSTMNQRRPGAIDEASINNKNGNTENLVQFALSKIERCDYFKSLQLFVEELGNISNRLRFVPFEERNAKLKSELMILNKKLLETPGIYIPLFSSSQAHCCLVHIPPEESVLLNSRERAPFLIIGEVLEGTVPSSSEQLHEYAKEYQKMIDTVNSNSLAKSKGKKNELSERSHGADTKHLEEVKESRKERIKKSEKPVTKHYSDQDLLNHVKTKLDSQPEVQIHVESAPASTVKALRNTKSQDALNPNEKPKPLSSGSLPLHKDTANTIRANERLTTSSPNSLKPKSLNTSKAADEISSGKTSGHTSGYTTPRGRNRAANKAMDDWVVLETPDDENRNIENDGILESLNSNGAKKRARSILFLREKWEEKEARIRNGSPYGSLSNWKLISLIVKFGDDCRQERMALQLINQFHRILTAAKLPLYLRPYNILVLSPEACLIETLTNAMSIHQLKKEHNGLSIGEYFRLKCGGVESHEYKVAQGNFIESTAAYSVVSYILQLKDRHNGNIMIDNEGHIIHIDFGFMFSNSPGQLNFETSPFKLTQEYIDFMDGLDSAKFQYFKVLVTSAFMEVRKFSDRIIGLVNDVTNGYQTSMSYWGTEDIR